MPLLRKCNGNNNRALDDTNRLRKLEIDGTMLAISKMVAKNTNNRSYLVIYILQHFSVNKSSPL